MLCLVLCLSIFPAGAFATEGEAQAETMEKLSGENNHEEFFPVEEPIGEEPPVEEAIVEGSPAEEPVVEALPEEEPVVEELPAEPVEVTFDCAETVDFSALAVYDAEGELVPPAEDAETGEPLYGTYSLLPGEYSYSFSAEGFEPLDNQHFTVEDAALTLPLTLTATSVEGELVAEEIPEEEPILEKTPAEVFTEELPAQPVVVTFECAEATDLSALTVYDAEGAVVLPLADAETGEPLYSTYSLLPGEYSYSFAAEGIAAPENVPFTVTGTEPTMTLALMQAPAILKATLLGADGSETEDVHYTDENGETQTAKCICLYVLTRSQTNQLQADGMP